MLQGIAAETPLKYYSLNISEKITVVNYSMKWKYRIENNMLALVAELPSQVAGTRVLHFKYYPVPPRQKKSIGIRQLASCTELYWRKLWSTQCPNGRKKISGKFLLRILGCFSSSKTLHNCSKQSASHCDALYSPCQFLFPRECCFV